MCSVVILFKRAYVEQVTLMELASTHSASQVACCDLFLHVYIGTLVCSSGSGLNFIIFF